MKLELIKRTEKGTGRIWYHVEIDGKSVDNTWAQNEKDANEKFEGVKKTIKQFPVDTTEVIKSEDVQDYQILLPFMR